MNTFYTKNDELSSSEKRSLWRSIRPELPGSQNHSYFTLHWKSFWIGQAAALLLTLAVFGVFSLVNTTFKGSKEPTIQQKYATTLQELISAQKYIRQPSTEPGNKSLQSELAGLEEIDQIIDEVRNDILINGSTQAKRNQLKRLYATKLDFAKKLILTPETTL